MLLFVKETVIRGWTVSYEKITCDARLLLQKESIKTIQISLPYIFVERRQNPVAPASCQDVTASNSSNSRHFRQHHVRCAGPLLKLLALGGGGGEPAVCTSYAVRQSHSLSRKRGTKRHYNSIPSFHYVSADCCAICVFPIGRYLAASNDEYLESWRIDSGPTTSGSNAVFRLSQ